MSKLGRVTKVKVLFLALVFVFNFDLYKISAAILEKGLLFSAARNDSSLSQYLFTLRCLNDVLANLMLWVFGLFNVKDVSINYNYIYRIRHVGCPECSPWPEKNA